MRYIIIVSIIVFKRNFSQCFYNINDGRRRQEGEDCSRKKKGFYILL